MRYPIAAQRDTDNPPVPAAVLYRPVCKHGLVRPVKGPETQVDDAGF